MSSSSAEAEPARAAAIPPNLKTGVSYAQAAEAPPLDTTPEPGKSYASAAAPDHDGAKTTGASDSAGSSVAGEADEARSGADPKRVSRPPPPPVEARSRTSLQEEDNYDDDDEGEIDGSTTENVSLPQPPQNTPRQLSPEGLRKLSEEKEKHVKPLTTTVEGSARRRKNREHERDGVEHSPVFKEREEGLNGYESGESTGEKRRQGFKDYTAAGTIVVPDVPALVSHTFSKEYVPPIVLPF